MSSLSGKPAILGGEPVFGETLPFAQPTLPELDEITQELKDVFASKNITNNKYVRSFEEKSAGYLGVKNIVAVSSCTSGLMLTMRAMGLEGEVIVPSFTFSATVQALIWNDLKPVFVDCDPDSFNIDTSLIENAITERTRAILAVYVFGMPPDIEGLRKLADRYNLKLIFDAAHAFGTRYHGISAGSFGDAEVFSLSPTKLLVAGEGGLISTDNDQLAYKLRIGRDYANPGDYNCQFPALNARMAEFNAILGLKGLETIEEKVLRRNQLAKLYRYLLGKIPGITFQKEQNGSRTTYKDLSILISPDVFGLSRDELAASLDEENIKTKKYYYPPVHRQKFFTSLFGFNGNKLPATNYISENILSLPIFSHMREEEVARICGAIRNIHQNRHRISNAIRSGYEDKLLSDLARVY